MGCAVPLTIDPYHVASKSIQCRAVAAAVFGDADRVEPVVTNTADKFPFLFNGTIDLLSRTTTHTTEREVFEVSRTL
jgi:ABC-type amino acid transport substrate-binding protein